MAKTPRTASRPALHVAVRRKKVSLMRGMNQVLVDHGLKARVRELHLEPMPATASECPDGQTLRVVCRTTPNGQTVCTRECA